MTDESSQEISDILRQAQDTKWAYAEINEFWEALSNPLHYGERMAEWLPDHDYIHNLLLDALHLHLEAPAHVLDLGAGSGRVSKMIMERFPDCRITLADASANMLGAAAAKLAPYAERCAIKQGDFFDNAFDFSGDSFDTIVAVFSICHGRHTSHYEHLYKKIHRWLKPGGLFICLDHILGAADPFTILNVAGWQRYLDAHLEDYQAREFILNTYQEDYPLPLGEHFRLLSTAGFHSSDILYKRDIFAIYTGLKLADR